MLNIDLAPTFIDLAGGEPPAFLDGLSMKPLLHQPSEHGSCTLNMTSRLRMFIGLIMKWYLSVSHNWTSKRPFFLAMIICVQLSMHNIVRLLMSFGASAIARCVSPGTWRDDFLVEHSGEHHKIQANCPNQSHQNLGVSNQSATT